MTDDQLDYILRAIEEPKKTAVVACCNPACAARWRTRITDALVERGALHAVSQWMVRAKNGSRVMLVDDHVNDEYGRENWRRGLTIDALVYD